MTLTGERMMIARHAEQGDARRQLIGPDQRAAIRISGIA